MGQECVTNKPMNIYVTGRHGFIGRHVVKELESRGHHLTEMVESQVFLHLAAAGVNDQSVGWDDLFRVNVIESLNSWRKAAEMGVERFIIAGSYSEYGTSADLFEHIPSYAPLWPITRYAASKAAASMAALAFSVDSGVELVVARLFQVYGDGEAMTRFYPSLRKAAEEGVDFDMSPGEQVRDFIPVGSVASALVDYADKAELYPGEPLVRNVGTGLGVRLKDFAAHWWSEWNATGQLKLGARKYRSDDLMRCVALP
jgi:nucleoside-diphosphate-sugar epimerase